MSAVVERHRSLLGQRVLVVGGTRGIGLEVARGARELGASVVVGARRTASLVEPGLEVRPIDVGDETSVRAFFADERDIDHVYLSAGVFVGGTGLDGDLTAFRASLDVRILGAIFVARAAVPKMKPRGSLTFTGGLSTDRPAVGAFINAVGTAATEQIARALALELAPRRVNAISPGWTDTPMWDAILGPEKAGAFAAVAEKIPSRRVATAHDAAAAVLFLMGNAAVSGEILHVDGGHRLV